METMRDRLYIKPTISMYAPDDYYTAKISTVLYTQVTAGLMCNNLQRIQNRPK